MSSYSDGNDAERNAETTPLLGAAASEASSRTASVAPLHETPPTAHYATATEAPSKQPQPLSKSKQPAAAEAGPDPNEGRAWGPPAGLPPRGEGDESLVIFRQAVGMGMHTSDGGACDVEQGRKLATGIYRAILKKRHSKSWQSKGLNATIYVCHFVQIVIGAALTSFGPAAGTHALAITVLGAVNTVIAGMLALFKGQGLPEKLHQDEIEFTRLQTWLEETDSLLEGGVLGRNRQEVDQLVETAFRKYNAALACEENNKAGNYVHQEPDGRPDGGPQGGHRLSPRK